MNCENLWMLKTFFIVWKAEVMIRAAGAGMAQRADRPQAEKKRDAKI